MTTPPFKTDLKTDIERFIALAGDFGALLKRETKALKKADFSAVDALQRDKRAMADKYNLSVRAMAEKRDSFGGLDTAMREKLIAARIDLTRILDENLRAVEAVRSAAQRIAARILDAARDAVTMERQTNYSAKGKAQAYASASLSINVDQRL